MKKNKFFDTIMITLILMCCFRILYPDAFTFNVIVDGSSSDSSNSSAEIDLPVYDTFEEFCDFYCIDMDYTAGTFDWCYLGCDPSGDWLFANLSSLYVFSYFDGFSFYIFGTPACYIDGELFYYYNTLSYYDLSSGFSIETEDVEWISQYPLI